MADLTAWSLVAETKEYVGPLTMSLDGVPIGTFEVQLTLSDERPDVSAWVSPVFVDGAWRVLVGAGTDFLLEAGSKYTVWLRTTDSPEVPVYRAGIVRAT
jgi:hypothetical protein